MTSIRVGTLLSKLDTMTTIFTGSKLNNTLKSINLKCVCPGFVYFNES